MSTFYAVHDRDSDEPDPYAVMVMTDTLRENYTKAYRWVPNFGQWVRDDGLLRDFHSHALDQLNRFEEIDIDRAARLTRTLPTFTAQWIIDSYTNVPERLVLDLSRN